MVETASTDNIVKEYKIGNTTIQICDAAYKDRTPEEIEATKKRLSEIGREILIEALRKEKLV